MPAAHRAVRRAVHREAPQDGAPDPLAEAAAAVYSAAGEVAEMVRQEALLVADLGVARTVHPVDRLKLLMFRTTVVADHRVELPRAAAVAVVWDRCNDCSPRCALAKRRVTTAVVAAVAVEATVAAAVEATAP